MSVFDPEYAPSSLCTTNLSVPCVFGTTNSLTLELHTESGEMPSSSAAARSKALNEEPGWRSPSVAMLNGLSL